MPVVMVSSHPPAALPDSSPPCFSNATIGPSKENHACTRETREPKSGHRITLQNNPRPRYSLSRLSWSHSHRNPFERPALAHVRDKNGSWPTRWRICESTHVPWPRTWHGQSCTRVQSRNERVVRVRVRQHRADGEQDCHGR